MKQIRTRGAERDYDWFASSPSPNFSSYENFKSDGDFSAFVEIDAAEKSWKACVEGIPTRRKDSKGRRIRLDMQGAGTLGDEDAEFFHKIVAYVFKSQPGKEERIGEIGRLLDGELTEDFVESLCAKKSFSAEDELEISAKLDSAAASLPSVQVSADPNALEEFSAALSDDSSYVEKFLACVSLLGGKLSDDFDGIVSAVYTTLPVDKNTLDEFCKNLSGGNKSVSGVILTEEKSSTLELPHTISVKKNWSSVPGKWTMKNLVICLIMLVIGFAAGFVISQKKSMKNVMAVKVERNIRGSYSASKIIKIEDAYQLNFKDGKRGELIGKADGKKARNFEYKIEGSRIELTFKPESSSEKDNPETLEAFVAKDGTIILYTQGSSENQTLTFSREASTTEADTETSATNSEN